jgi:hypothetical protein
MRFANGLSGPAANVNFRRALAVAVVLGLGAVQGSCGSFPGYVADHWPHWAGGMPDDVPPRPGAPGYDEFIAHGQTGPDAGKSTAAAPQPIFSTAKPKSQPAATAAEPSAVTPAPAVPAQAVDMPTPTDDRRTEDPSIVKGGLY